LLNLNLSTDDNVYIIGSVPEVINFKALYECQHAANSDSSCMYETINKSKRILYRKEFNTQLKKLLEKSSFRAIFVDPFDTLCDKKAGRCFGIQNDNMLYSDQNHLSLSGALTFIDKLNAP
jgi:hypothetical protein